MDAFRHRNLLVDGLSIHVVETGRPAPGSLLLLHGWPEDWSLYEKLMRVLGGEMHLVAMDLPGIGGSGTPPAGDKRSLARHVDGVIAALGLDAPVLVGHDVGGQIAYAHLHAHPGRARRAVLMNIAIPGLEPWEEVLRNPHIWHFAFHAVPGLPEALVAGHVPAYFDFFYDALASQVIDPQKRQAYVQAYARPSALRAGFEWYRAFPQDERDNRASAHQVVRAPVLYVRGAEEPGDLGAYARGLRAGGVQDLRTTLIPDCGHFTPDEQPEALAAVLRAFVRTPLPEPGPDSRTGGQ